ncbi:hypothetical protein [Mesorhizobium sp. 1B3]|uniref:hypothetical protein n=1 Tax=Mesorhizobium sp. 1B3 TaxID=3243599 RepID=UPI003D9845AC
MAPELNAWTSMAAQAYGIYAGVNEALKMTRGKHAVAKHRAEEVRQEMIMMTLIRLFAVLDRQSEVSLQSAYRFLKQPNALDEVARCYSGGREAGSGTLSTCSVALDKFLSVYRAVDFKSFGRIQSFRNGQIAHIVWPDAEKAKITYSEVEAMMRACCDMAGQLTLMTSGLNDWPEERLDEAHREAYEFWLAAILADADGRLKVGDIAAVSDHS